MREKFIEKTFQEKTLELISQAVSILRQYAAAGYTMTLRQVYYQLVARDYIPNNQQSYKRVGSILNDARLAGLVDWNFMEDRTRNLESNPHWTSPEDIIQAAAASFAFDKWLPQPNRVEVWIEKDALTGVIAPVCEALDVPFFSCRGYTSQSELYAAGKRLRRYYDRKQVPFILHLGDHDPSGIDMTRDVAERLSMFAGIPIEVRRLALNMDQVEEYNPPPNPAKLTDSRVAGYLLEYGEESWELDALEPTVLGDLITQAVERLRDGALWRKSVREEEEVKLNLQRAADNWDMVAEWLEEDTEEE